MKTTFEYRNPDSPYQSIINNVSEIFSKMSENVIHPSDVAKVVVDVVNLDDPEFRYIVGTDAKKIIYSKKNL